MGAILDIIIDKTILINNWSDNILDNRIDNSIDKRIDKRIV